MKTLRATNERFENLPGYPFAPHYTEVPDGEGGSPRIHRVDEGPADGKVVARATIDFVRSHPVR